MKNINGKHLGYFTSETIQNGVHDMFKFTHHSHTSLTERTSGIVVKKGVDDSFQVDIFVPEEVRDTIRELIKQKTLVVAKFEKGNLSEVYKLEATGIYGIT